MCLKESYPVNRFFGRLSEVIILLLVSLSVRQHVV